eukprot:ctg_4411.g627
MSARNAPGSTSDTRPSDPPADVSAAAAAAKAVRARPGAGVAHRTPRSAAAPARSPARPDSAPPPRHRRWATRAPPAAPDSQSETAAPSAAGSVSSANGGRRPPAGQGCGRDVRVPKPPGPSTPVCRHDGWLWRIRGALGSGAARTTASNRRREHRSTAAVLQTPPASRCARWRIGAHRAHCPARTTPDGCGLSAASPD